VALNLSERTTVYRPFLLAQNGIDFADHKTLLKELTAEDSKKKLDDSRMRFARNRP
jgi:hypothetical protein